MAAMDIHLSYLISKKLTGEINDAEMHELNHLLDADPVLKEAYKTLQGTWLRQSQHKGVPANIERLLRKMEEQDRQTSLSEIPQIFPQEEPASFSKIRVLYWALAAASVIALGIFWFYPEAPHQISPQAASKKAKASPTNVVVTKPGSQTHLVLVDGTEVWLNANSKLTYGEDFNGKTRDVYLSGEAFFDVESNPQLPFIIHTDKVNVKVTGTTFNVRAYPDEKQVETSLIHGKVEVSLVSKPEKIFYLKPAEKLVLQNVEPEDEKQEAIRKIKGLDRVVDMIPQFTSISYDPIDSLPIETAWINNQLAFMEESFGRLAEKMEKWYGVRIIFDNPQLETLRFTGKFEKESLREALEALRIIGKFQFTINQNTVIIFNTKN